MPNRFNERLSEAMQNVPAPLAEATISMLEFARHKEADPRLIFLTRALNALRDLAKHNYVGDAACASTDLELFLKLLEEPETLNILRKSDPLAGAKLRGIRAKTRLLDADGGCVSDEEAAQLLGVSRQSIAKARAKGQYFALPRGQTGYVYPVWQFETGRPITGLKKVLQALQEHDPWMQVSFMLSPNKRLDNKRPLDALREGQIEDVVMAASAFGEHGAA